MKTLPTGVHVSSPGRYRAVLRVNYRQYHLGVFNDVETASNTYKQAKKMTDDLLLRLGSPVIVEKIVEKKVVEYIPFDVPVYLDKPSFWRRLFNRAKS